MYPAVASAEAGSYATIFVSVASLVAPLAQLDRASGYEPEGRVFESPRAHHFFLIGSRFPTKIENIPSAPVSSILTMPIRRACIPTYNASRRSCKDARLINRAAR
jgi:hypothetical protein